LTDEGREIIKKELGEISYLRLGNSDLVRRADEVMALGYPLSMQSLKSTTGVISGREGGLIQISAAINPGNSGGPLLNLNGEVIGVNSSKAIGAAVDNVGYMIPINDFRVALPDLRNVKLLRKPFLGILFNNGTEALTEYLGNPQPGGCYVAEVIKNSTLYKAGIETGDMVYEINGHKIDVYGEMNVVWSEDKISLIDYVSRLSIGQDINLVVYRKGERKEINVKFTEAELPSVRQIYPWLEDIDYEVFAGMVVMQLSANHIRRLVKQAPGLMYYAEMKNQADPVLIVTHVFPTSQLYRTRTLIAGATLNEVNGVPVSTLEELRAAYKTGDGKALTIRATDRYTQASDNILVVLPYEKVLQEESMLARTYCYPLSETAKMLLTDYTKKIKRETAVS
jgi:S1-C subfamily serine protease